MTAGISLFIVLFVLSFFGMLAWVYRQYKDFTIFLVLVIMYFYTIHGYLIYLMETGFGVKGNYYDLIVGYPYYLADNYAMLLALVILFLWCVSYGAGLLIGFKRSPRSHADFRIVISNSVLLLLGFLLLLSFVAYYWYLLGNIENTGVAYLQYKESFLDRPFARVVQQLPLIAASLFIFGSNIGGVGKYLLVTGSVVTRMANVCFLILTFLVMTLLGDKNVVVGVLLLFVCFKSLRTPIRAKYLMAMLLLLVVANTISVIRFMDFSNGFDPVELLFHSFLHLLEHGEAVTSYSLFAAISRDIPMNYGQSLIGAIGNLIPSFVYRYEKYDPFLYYSSFTSSSDDPVGWGISLFTDLYLNFSIIGVVAGGFLFGKFHNYILKNSHKSLLHLLVMSSIVSSLPGYLRNGINFASIAYSIFVAILLYIILFVFGKRSMPVNNYVSCAFRGLNGSYQNRLPNS